MSQFSEKSHTNLFIHTKIPKAEYLKTIVVRKHIYRIPNLNESIEAQIKPDGVKYKGQGFAFRMMSMQAAQSIMYMV